MQAKKGFTLVELMVVLTVIALLLSLVAPNYVGQVKHAEEAVLREIREAIDAYKQAADEGLIERKADASGYPPTLAVLAEGVQNKRKPEEARLYFLRRVPGDPVSGEPWGLRSYASPADAPQQGADVFDVYSRGEGSGMNGVPYGNW